MKKTRFSVGRLAVPAIITAALFSSTASRGSEVSQSQFSSSDPVITFATGSTALPVVPGVTFSGGDSSSLNGGFGPQYFGNFTAGQGYTYLTISFAQPVQAVGANLIHVTPAMTGETEVVFDQSGNVIESESANYTAGANSVAGFLGIAETGNDIYSVQWQYSSPGFFGVGDVTYGTAMVVPEPSALALILMALPLLIFRRVATMRQGLRAFVLA